VRTSQIHALTIDRIILQVTQLMSKQPMFGGGMMGFGPGQPASQSQTAGGRFSSMLKKTASVMRVGLGNGVITMCGHAMRPQGSWLAECLIACVTCLLKRLPWSCWTVSAPHHAEQTCSFALQQSSEGLVKGLKHLGSTQEESYVAMPRWDYHMVWPRQSICAA